ncbi:hypothetical protein PsorP6_012232 [Peronosclerospora sorghi]|uniref:Uncharacterized protein n=1 Tax=Peronosclerospora sorghi TaxID=230839 RepID=A0ACC0WKL9_9STRA|nr:hypothetical protein PsorP6_012232 [Peronosclerospora sorghi]
MLTFLDVKPSGTYQHVNFSLQPASFVVPSESIRGNVSRISVFAHGQLFSIHIKEVDVHRSITHQAMEINQHRLPHDLRFANDYKLNTRSNFLQFYVSNAITIGLV